MIAGKMNVLHLNGLVLLLFSLIDTEDCLYLSMVSATKSANESLIVTCKDEAGRAVSWHGPKGPIKLRTRPKLQENSWGTSIVFDATIPEDSGKYWCASPSEKREFKLDVEAALTFMDTPLEQKGIEGSDVTLRCEVKGGSITWSYDDFTEIKDPRIVVMGDGLLIKNVNRSDDKTYICKAFQQRTGTIDDRRIKLTVLYPPNFKDNQKEENVYGILNSYINLTCEVDAVPTAKFEWLSKTNNISGSGINKPNLSILYLPVGNKTFGKYKCVAYNSEGKAGKVINLREGVKPYPPQFIELRGANSDLLDLGIKGPDLEQPKMPKNMEPTGFNVQYRIAGKDDWRNEDFVLSEENSYPLRNLQDDTDYEVMAATRNLAGLSDYTNSSSFRTLKSQGTSVDSPLLHIPAVALALIYFVVFNRNEVW